MDPLDVLRLAKYLQTPPKECPTEAGHRSACSRAYYAAFTFARDVLLGASYPISKDVAAHQRVVALLKASSDMDVKAAGASLDSLRSWRNEADYDVGRHTKAGGYKKLQAQLAVASADTIVNAIDEARSRDSRLAVPASMK